MKKRIAIFILAILAIAILIVYLVPVSSVPFRELYAKVDPTTTQSLEKFRQTTLLQEIQVDGVAWKYVIAGDGSETILFLHGMTGAHDIWWQQIQALQGKYRVIAVTYPAVDTLEGLASGITAILAREEVKPVNVVGTSLGGYLAQYLVATRPTLIKRVVLGNTFPPNNLIAEKNRVIGALLPFLPEWLVMSTLRQSIVDAVYPAAGRSELVLAFLMEQLYGPTSKAQIVARYRCVVEPFTAPVPKIPIMIIEADNDPLVEKVLREQLKTTYPSATVRNLGNVGHFAYLNEAATYTRMLEECFGQAR